MEHALNVLEADTAQLRNTSTRHSPHTRTKESSVQLSVVIPMYNQEKNAHASLSRIKKVLASVTSNYELVIINDGSTDGTLDIILQEEKTDPHVRVISYFPNMGKGYAVRTGVIASYGDAVMFTDGDMDISPHVIAEYIKELENCDLVIASKRHPLSKVDAPISRKFLSRMFSLLVRTSVGMKIKDTQSGLKAGNGSALRTICKAMLVKRYAFDVELLTIATLLGLKIGELPVEIRLDRGFKIREIIRMLVDVLAIAYRYKIIHWYQKRLAA